MNLSWICKLILLALFSSELQAAGAQVTVGFDEPHNPLTLSVPGQPAALQVDLLHLKVEQNQLDGSATRRRVQASDAHGWVFSAFLYPLDKKQTATELNDQNFVDLRRGPRKMDSRLKHGSIYYLHQDWTRAAAHYESSLQLERQKRALSQKQWNVLVDNLGMAYGMSGEISKAKATFEYGVQESPAYPMFRYNLACADSELGDLDATMDQLKLAFQYKSNSNPGEGIPDPAKDDSFKRYLSDARFAMLAKQLCPSSVQTQGGWQCR